MNISDEKRVLKAVTRLEKEWAIKDAAAAKKVKPAKVPKKKKDKTPIEIKLAKQKAEKKAIEKKAKDAEKKRLADNQAKIDATKD